VKNLILSLSFILIAIPTTIVAQDSSIRYDPNPLPNNSAFIGFGGSSLTLFSVNYEHFFYGETKNSKSIEIGVGAISNFRDTLNTSAFSLPIRYSFNFHRNNSSRLYVAPGITLLNQQATDSLNRASSRNSLSTSVTFGYKIVEPSGGFYLNIGITPYVSIWEDERLTGVESPTLFSPYFTVQAAVGVTFDKLQLNPRTKARLGL
jgi:hypothetical protein